MTKIYRDREGNIINIGEWNLRIKIEKDKKGKEVEVITNPLPKGATYTEGEVVVESDGSLFVKDSSLHKVYKKRKIN